MNRNNSSRSAAQNQDPSISIFKRFTSIVLVISFLVLILLMVLIFRLITQCSRRKPRKIQRQAVIIKKHHESTGDHPHSVLLESYPERTLNNVRIIDDMLVSDPNGEQKPIGDGSRHSTISIMNSPLNESDDDDDLSDLDLTNIPLRRVKPLNNNLSDPSVAQPTKRSSYSSSENLYVAEFKERDAASKLLRYPRSSGGSKTSEESYL